MRFISKKIIALCIAVAIICVNFSSFQVNAAEINKETKNNKFAIQFNNNALNANAVLANQLLQGKGRQVGSFTYRGRLSRGKVLGKVTIDRDFKRAVCVLGRDGDECKYIVIQVGKYLSVDSYTDQYSRTQTWVATQSAGTYEIKVGFTESNWCHDCQIYFYSN